MRVIKSNQMNLVDGKWIVQPSALEVPEALAGEESTAEEEPTIDPALLIAEAQAEAERIVREAEAQAQELIETVTRAAYEDGLTQGKEEAFQQGLQEWQERFEKLEAAAKAFLSEREERLNQAEPDAVRLALLVAQKILLREPKDANLVKGIVNAAIARVTGGDVVRVRLNPQDVSKLVNPLQPPPKFEVVGDAAVGLGGCVIETATGRVDASFASQFEELVQAVIDAPPDDDPALKGSMGDLRKPPTAGPGGARGRGGGMGGGGFGGFGR